MPPGRGYDDDPVAAFLRNLVGGFEGGMGLRERRTDRRLMMEEFARQREREKREDLRSEEDRSRQRAFQDFQMREQGISFVPEGTERSRVVPGSAPDLTEGFDRRVGELRQAVGQALQGGLGQFERGPGFTGLEPPAPDSITGPVDLPGLPDVGIPPGPSVRFESYTQPEDEFVRTGPSPQERQAEAERLRRSVGAGLVGERLGIEGDEVSALEEFGLLDEVAGSVLGEEDAPNLRTISSDQGIFSFNPRSGETSPVMSGDEQLRPRPRASELDSGVSPTQLLVAQRQRVLGAARAYTQIDPSDYIGRPDALRARQREVLRTWGYDQPDQLASDMQRLGVAPGSEDGEGGEGGGGASERGGRTWQDRAEELRRDGMEEDEIVDTLREEGWIG